MTIEKLLEQNRDVLLRMKRRDSDNAFNQKCEKKFEKFLKKGLTITSKYDIIQIQ